MYDHSLWKERPWEVDGEFDHKLYRYWMTQHVLDEVVFDNDVWALDEATRWRVGSSHVRYAAYVLGDSIYVAGEEYAPMTYSY